LIDRVANESRQPSIGQRIPPGVGQRPSAVDPLRQSGAVRQIAEVVPSAMVGRQYAPARSEDPCPLGDGLALVGVREDDLANHPIDRLALERQPLGNTANRRKAAGIDLVDERLRALDSNGIEPGTPQVRELLAVPAAHVDDA